MLWLLYSYRMSLIEIKQLNYYIIKVKSLNNTAKIRGEIVIHWNKLDFCICQRQAKSSFTPAQFACAELQSRRVLPACREGNGTGRGIQPYLPRKGPELRTWDVHTSVFLNQGYDEQTVKDNSSNSGPILIIRYYRAELCNVGLKLSCLACGWV